jgi:hypothetical protein
MQDFAERCPAGTGTNGANCPVPKAHAWDSHDEEIKVSKQIYLMDDDGQTGVVPADKVEYAKRRTYLIKYDASDAAGNRAEQLVFALILDDVKAPRITCDDWSANLMRITRRSRAPGPATRTPPAPRAAAPAPRR